MRLLFKQRLFSWMDSYDIFNEAGETLYTVKGQLGWGHCFKIFDACGMEVGYVQQKVFTWMPKFEIYQRGQYCGCICREFTFFRPKYRIDYNAWHVEGDFFEWDYTITDLHDRTVATVSKELLNWTDTYAITVQDPQDALSALMLVLAIDAEKCSRN